MWSRLRLVSRITPWYCLSAGLFTTGQTKQEIKVNEVMPNGSKSTKIYLQDISSDLTHSQLIKNASSATVDAASVLLSQTAIAIIAVYESYTKSIKELVDLLKLHAECLGDESAEDDVWQMIIQARVEVNDKMKAVQELTGLLNTSRKVLENAAEVAYLAGCEYSAITANDKLHTTHVLVENARISSQKMESELAQAQQHDIEDVMNFEDSKNRENSQDEEC